MVCADLPSVGGMIGSSDLWIATAALAHGLIMVTATAASLTVFRASSWKAWAEPVWCRARFTRMTIDRRYYPRTLFAGAVIGLTTFQKRDRGSPACVGTFETSYMKLRSPLFPSLIAAPCQDNRSPVR